MMKTTISESLASRFYRGLVSAFVLAAASLCLAPATPTHAQATAIMSGGSSHMCTATATDGTVRCWGQPDMSGQPSSAAAQAPFPPLSISGAVAISAGDASTCALRNDGAVLCWGSNFNGQSGTATNVGNATRLLTPTVVSGTGSVVALATERSTANHMCAITASFGVKCWGDNRDGQLGNGSTTSTHVPQDVTGLGPVAAVTANVRSTCALGFDGGVSCWGASAAIGDSGGSRTRPAAVAGLSANVVQIASGNAHTCALMRSGTVKCFGSSGFAGTLGDGRLQSSATPVDVIGVSNAIQIIAGYWYSCALIADGSVKCWGDSRDGAGGPDGIVRTSSSNRYNGTPVTATGFSAPVVSIGGGYGYACAATTSGSVECWGLAICASCSANASRPERVTAHLGGYKINPNPVMTEYRHNTLNYFFQTSDVGEKLLLKAAAPAFEPTGLSYQVLPASVYANARPLTRYFFSEVARGGSRGSHFYTLVEAERNALNGLNPTNAATPRLPQNEGTDSFAYVPAVEGVGGSCASGLVPVYRAFRGQTRFPDDPNHRFTTDLTTYNGLVAAGWDGEGVKLCVPAPN